MAVLAAVINFPTAKLLCVRKDGRQSFRDLSELFGEETISQMQVEMWFDKVKSGDVNLTDEEERGRPSDFDDQALLTAVKEDESLTSRMLAEDFNGNQSTIVTRLTKLVKTQGRITWANVQTHANYDT
ncbi:hypothetical protein NQ318_018270 [Aromia moschata]|uniref:Mos1 transposase HTH domain-containing protein n=1 Tax=Aromia moschata TaxID=1265417 RepID=A0AAV8ZE84_9CUCU|nr:hypothetical protein NQ318_018270 [Aromia moschata]